MKYTINISAADPRDGIVGPGGLGAFFSSVEDLKAIFKKYITRKDMVVRITISSAETTYAIKEYGDNLAAKGQNIYLFALAAIAKKDKFSGIRIYYRPGGWYDKNGEFKFILKRGDKTIPQYNKKLAPILRELGVQI